mgnify:CR=1 FL=1
MIDTLVKRGGFVKDLHGAKNVYYQVNATYYSALGEDDRRMLLARALQLFMPGKPQVWYWTCSPGRTTTPPWSGPGPAATRRSTAPTSPRSHGRRPGEAGGPAPAGAAEAAGGLPRVPGSAAITVKAEGSTDHGLGKGGQIAALKADLADASFTLTVVDEATGKEVYSMKQ